MLFPRPRTHMGEGLPPLGHFAPNLELWDKDQTNPWDVLSQTVPEFSSLGHVLTPPGGIKVKKIAILRM